MSVIKLTRARQVFDSRGFPTVEAEIVLSDGSVGQSIVPSGASTGTYEAHELRDKNNEYLKKGVLQAVKNINLEINKAIKNKPVFNQKKIDQILIELDWLLSYALDFLASKKSVRSYQKYQQYHYIGHHFAPTTPQVCSGYCL